MGCQVGGALCRILVHVLHTGCECSERSIVHVARVPSHAWSRCGFVAQPYRSDFGRTKAGSRVFPIALCRGVAGMKIIAGVVSGTKRVDWRDHPSPRPGRLPHIAASPPSRQQRSIFPPRSKTKQELEDNLHHRFDSQELGSTHGAHSAAFSPI